MDTVADSDLNINEYLRILLKSWKLFIIVPLACLAVTSIITFTANVPATEYTATSTILFDSLGQYGVYQSIAENIEIPDAIETQFDHQLLRISVTSNTPEQAIQQTTFVALTLQNIAITNRNKQIETQGPIIVQSLPELFSIPLEVNTPKEGNYIEIKPEPQPHKRNLAIAFILGTLLSIFLIFGIEYFRTNWEFIKSQ